MNMGQDMSIEEEKQFYYRHKVEVHLAMSAVAVQDSSKTRFAIKQGDEPSLPYSILKKGHSSFLTAQNLFKKLTGTDPQPWFIVKQVGVFDQGKENTIVILYAILIPEVVPLIDKNIVWVDYLTLSKHPTLLTMMGHACNYYKVNN